MIEYKYNQLSAAQDLKGIHVATAGTPSLCFPHSRMGQRLGQPKRPSKKRPQQVWKKGKTADFWRNQRRFGCGGRI